MMRAPINLWTGYSAHEHFQFSGPPSFIFYKSKDRLSFSGSGREDKLGGNYISLPGPCKAVYLSNGRIYPLPLSRSQTASYDPMRSHPYPGAGSFPESGSESGPPIDVWSVL